jgi:enoyl-CoA hydratase/carnithine racemase
VTRFPASVPLTTDWSHFHVDVADRVATITLSRPERLNALTFDVYADLRELFHQLALRNDVAAIILTGEGRGFCSGGDVDEIIGELLGMDARDLLDFTRMTGAVVNNMRECPAPIIAAVNGVAAGAGAVLALAADFRILASEAKFRFLFTQVGLSGGDMGAAYLLPRVVGLGRATEILMFGDTIHAADAVAMGLAGSAVAADELLEKANALARRLADGPALAYAATKLLLSREQDMDFAGALEHEALTQALLMNTRDHAEFHAAFSEGRPPRWTGR